MTGMRGVLELQVPSHKLGLCSSLPQPWKGCQPSGFQLARGFCSLEPCKGLWWWVGSAEGGLHPVLCFPAPHSRSCSGLPSREQQLTARALFSGSQG